jgi:glycerophosphoryl diester phosphodiesterase
MLAPHVQHLGWLVARPIAHRGLHDITDGRLENTMAAFKAAIASQYAIECDLQLSADGEAVVFHDNRLDRLTMAKGPMSQLTTAELRQLELRDSKERIPILAELLHAVQGQVPLMIELKSHWNGSTALARRSLDILKNYAGRFALMSFDPDLVEAIRHHAPQATRGIVADRVADRSWSRLPLPRRLELRHFLHVERSLPHFVSFQAGGLPWPPVTKLRAAGLPVVAWTVRSSAEAISVHRYCDQITFEGFRP